ncbi:hypothetical protein AgCh_029491 [Apium graveolens]
MHSLFLTHRTRVREHLSLLLRLWSNSCSARNLNKDFYVAGVRSHDIVNIENAKEVGYAMSTTEELKFVKEVAEVTGFILDPVYSGKAAYGMMKEMAENPTKWEGRRVLFIHTGGLLGPFDKTEELWMCMNLCCGRKALEKRFRWTS